jgi:HEAT repeat protein/tRNA A-37 threonylcarbamoyl transferase component Bud32
MKILSTFKAERSISKLLEEHDVNSPTARKALETLRSMGPDAIPKVIDALAVADKSQTAVRMETLATHVSDRSLPMYAEGLRNSNARCVTGVAWALSSSSSYDPNKVLDLLGEEDVSVPAVIDVLRTKKQRLGVSALLRRAYSLPPREKAALFKIVGEIADEASVPDLVSRLTGKDLAVRIHLIHILSRFKRPDVSEALQSQLRDPNKSVRQAALAALLNQDSPKDVKLICSMLLDPDLEVQSKAVDLLVKMRHPDTMKHLVKVLKDENEYARRSAVEVLNEIADPTTIRHLLNAIEDDDWWVRSRAADALATIGGPKVMDAVLQLIRDQNENIRRSAIEILNQTKDERAVDHLIEATRDGDWWVRERAADALGEIGDPKATIALSRMLKEDVRSVPAALRALGKIGNEQVLAKVLPLLDSPEKEIRVEAVNAIAKLTSEQTADTIKAKLQPLMTGGDETIARVAADAVVRIDNRFSATLSESDRDAARVSASDSLAERMSGGATLLEDAAKTEIIAPVEVPGSRLDITKLRPGDLIETRYRFIEQIGKGAFGTVLLVEDIVVEERLILKFLNANVSSDEEMLKRFVHELRYSRKITHENVIRIYDFVSLGGNYAISMEYFPSHTLGAELTSKKPLPFEKTVRWSRDIATGMSVAHSVGIVHRDLKPANILINDSGLLKIVDFGVAAAASSGDTQLTKTGYVIGSPKYMAPEQILGKKVDVRADIYSLGVIVYEMLTGQPPYSKGDHMAVMYQHVQGKCQPCEELNPDIPPPLASIVGKAMAVDKMQRFASMDEICEALDKVA